MKGCKFRIPKEGSEELDIFYNIAFDDDSFCASWAGKIGHYPYGDDIGKAGDFDGYVYIYPTERGLHKDVWWKMTADSCIAKCMCKEYVEINI